MPSSRCRQAFLLIAGACLSASVNADSSHTSYSSTPCFEFSSSASDSAPYNVHEFIPDIREWMRDRTQPIKERLHDVFSQPLRMTTKEGALDAKDWPLDCFVDLLGITLTNELLSAVTGTVPWIYFFINPWEDLCRSPWPVFELVAAWSVRQPGQKESVHWPLCPSELNQIWLEDLVAAAGEALKAALVAPELTASAAKMAAVALLSSTNIQTALNYVRISSGDPLLLCFTLPRFILLSALALWRKGSLLSPSYALRYINHVVQMAWAAKPDRSQSGQGPVVPPVLEDLAAMHWPVLPLLSRVASVEKARRPRLGGQNIERSTSAQANISSSTPADGHSQFAVLSPGAASQLAHSLQVAHTFLSLAGIEYIAIAGTLLGAVRHSDRIPWDDDVDLCVDAAHEWKLISMIMALEARQLKIDRTRELSWNSMRAVKFLDHEKHTLRVDASRSLRFIVESEEQGVTNGVDIWQCFGLADGNELHGMVALMSRRHGPKIDRSAVVPRRKLPFGGMAIWVPSDPEQILRSYMEHSGWSPNFREVCRARKIHSAVGVEGEFTEEVPCESMVGNFPYCQPWRTLNIASDDQEHNGDKAMFSKIEMSIRALLETRMPGFLVVGPVVAHITSCGFGWQPKMRALVPTEASGGREGSCEALLWQSDDQEDDILQLGVRSRGHLPVRSCICSFADGSESFVWEDVLAAP